MLRTYIVDDEAPARSRLASLLKPFQKQGEIEIVGEAKDGVEAVEKLSEETVDLVFLDIRMPGLDGFDVIERLAPETRPVVVFTTAYDEYAIRAFDANAVDYLLKPISTDRLAEAIARAGKVAVKPDDRASRDDRVARLLDWVDGQATGATPASTQQPIEQLSIPYRDRILVTPVERIVSIEIAEGITRVYVIEEGETGTRPKLRQHIVSHTLDQLSGMLDSETFMRVHRSAIVQFKQIKELIPWFSGRYKLILTGGHEVIASRERSKLLKERLGL